MFLYPIKIPLHRTCLCSLVLIDGEAGPWAQLLMPEERDAQRGKNLSQCPRAAHNGVNTGRGGREGICKHGAAGRDSPLTRTAAGAALPGAGRLPSPPPHAAASTRTSATAPHALADGEMTVPEGLAGCRVPLV